MEPGRGMSEALGHPLVYHMGGYGQLKHPGALHGAVWITRTWLTWFAEMALFHCTFLSLKARNNRTVQLSPDEYNLRSERKLFQAYVYYCAVTAFPSSQSG